MRPGIDGVFLMRHFASNVAVSKVNLRAEPL